MNGTFDLQLLLVTFIVIFCAMVLILKAVKAFKGEQSSCSNCPQSEFNSPVPVRVRALAQITPPPKKS
jgi:hypothetical protein